MTRTANSFAGIESATTTTGKSLYLEPGTFLLEIQSTKQDWQTSGMEYFAVSFKILRSDNETMPEGMVASRVIKRHYENSYLGEIKNFIAATLKKYEHEITEDIAELAVSEKQPLVGHTVQAHLWQKEGKKFTHVNYFPAGENDSK